MDAVDTNPAHVPSLTAFVAAFWGLVAAILVPLHLLAVFGHFYSGRVAALALYAVFAAGGSGAASALLAGRRLRCDSPPATWDSDWLLIGAGAGAAAVGGGAVALGLHLAVLAGSPAAEALQGIGAMVALTAMAGIPVVGAIEGLVVGVLSLLHLRRVRRHACGRG